MTVRDTDPTMPEEPTTPDPVELVRGLFTVVNNREYDLDQLFAVIDPDCGNSLLTRWTVYSDIDEIRAAAERLAEESQENVG